MIKKLKENKKIFITVLLIIVTIVILALAIFLFKDSKQLEAPNDNIETEFDDDLSDELCQYNDFHKYQLEIGNNIDDYIEIRNLCLKEKKERNIITDIKKLNGLTKADLDQFIELLTTDERIYATHDLYPYNTNFLTIADIYYGKTITSNCYSPEVMNELLNLLFNQSIDDILDDQTKREQIKKQSFLKVGNYYCSNVTNSEAQGTYELTLKEEANDTITYHLKRKSKVAKSDVYNEFIIIFKKYADRYIIDWIGHDFSYDLDNKAYQKELEDYSRKTNFHFDPVLQTEDLVKFGYGFEKNLRLNNIDDLKEISDELVAYWGGMEYFNNYKELSVDTQIRLLEEYISPGECLCYHKNVLRENYRHLFGEDIKDAEIDKVLKEYYSPDSFTENFICGCNGTGIEGYYGRIDKYDEQQSNNEVSFYYEINPYFQSDFDTLEEWENETAIAKVTFRLNKGYYNLVSIVKIK